MSAALIAGAGMMAGASILQGFMASRNKKNEAAVAKYNAAVAREDKKAIEYQTKFMSERQAEEGERTQADLESGIGGSGTVSTQGANYLALALQASETDLRNFLLNFQGRIEAGKAESEAIGYDTQKKMARIGSRQALIGGFLGAGASAMSALGSIPQKTAPASYTPASTGSGAYGGTGGGWSTGGASRSMRM